MAKKVPTPAETLRSFTQRKWVAARDYVADMDELRSVLEEAKDKLEEVSQAVLTLREFADFLPALAEQNIGTEEQAQNVITTVDELETVMSFFPADDIEYFVEHYEAARDALDSYADIKESDPYSGKKDDLEESWGECESSLDLLADALDNMSAAEESE